MTKMAVCTEYGISIIWNREDYCIELYRRVEVEFFLTSIFVTS